MSSSAAETGDSRLEAECASTVEGGVKGSRIYLSGGVP
jgi:hypothetical protein